MNRSDLLDKIEIIQIDSYTKNTGVNEEQLETRERIIDLFVELQTENIKITAE